MVERLQVKASSIGRILTNLEKKYHNTHDKDDAMKKSPSGQSLSKRQPVTIQRIPAFNPNKVRKSPSSEVAAALVAQDDNFDEMLKESQELQELKEEAEGRQEKQQKENEKEQKEHENQQKELENQLKEE
jgi:hypothetical protein